MTRQPNTTAMNAAKKSSKSHELDLVYQESKHKEALVVKDEEIRRQQLQVTLLRDENAQLKGQTTQLDSQVNALSSQYDEVRVELDSMAQKCRDQENRLRSQTREHSTLRTELLSLNNVTQDSTKLLTEKLALSREVAVLKPEVEHLRSQLAHQKDVLAEKLALERQLNTIEVELANEKRATQRAAQRQASSEAEAEDDLRQKVQALEEQLAGQKTEMQGKIQELEKQLAKEKRSVQQHMKQAAAAEADEKLQQRVEELEQELEEQKRDAVRSRKAVETELSEARGQIDIFEQRIGDLKAKLREVRDELRSTRAELASADEKAERKATSAAAEVVSKKAKNVTKLQLQRKRRVEETATIPDILQTPGAGDDNRTKRPLKKRGFDPALVAAKSNFSITPFLNKTINVLDDSTDAAPVAAEAAADKSKTSEASVAENPTDGSPDADEVDTSIEDSILGNNNSARETTHSIDVTTAVATTTKAAMTGEVPKRRGRPPKEKVLGEVPVSKRNVKVPLGGRSLKAAKAVAPSEPTADKTTTTDATVNESASEQENVPPASSVVSLKEKNAVPKPKAAAPVVRNTTEAEPKKKKRKILGASSKTLFDDDDDDTGDKEDNGMARLPKASVAGSVSATGAAPAVKRSVKAFGSGRPMAAGGAKRSMLGGVRNAFGAAGGFSPLKRDRRGVNASFLA